MKTFTALGVFFFSFQLTCRSEEIKIYLSPDGNDSWAGTIEKPYVTLQRARDAIRELKKNSKFTRQVTVYLRDGLYELSQPFILKPEDSGNELCPIVYTAYPGEKPIISGGKKISAKWKIYKDKIMVCSLNEEKSGKWNFRQLFVDGKRQVRARTPNSTYFRIEKSDENIGNSAFKFREGDLKKWNNLNSVEVVLFHTWNESRLLISDVNPENNLVTFTGPRGGQLLTKGTNTNRYYVENALEFLDKQGEWYLDYNSGMLYYWPASPIEKSEIRAPFLKQLITLEGMSKEKKYIQYITFSGLTFIDTDWSLPKEGYPGCVDVGDIVFPSALIFDGVSHCILKNNCFRNIGTYAVEVTGYANQIIENEIYDIGGGGIILRNYNKEPNIISYNSIHNCGEVYQSAVGINIDDGGGIISHNLIHDISHSGIYTRHWATGTQAIERRNQEQSLLIEYNEIYNVMQDLNDGAGIFVRDSNIVINNNLIHDVFSDGIGTPGWGIYLGCETRNTKVENNLVYRTSGGLHVWYSNRNITILNNVFINSDLCIIKSSNTKDRHHESMSFIRNIFYFSKTETDIFIIEGENSAPVESDNNIFWNPRGCVWLRSVIWGLPGVDYFVDWQKRGFDKHSIVADPQFVNSQIDDYSLKRNSPAFKVGFQPIDISNVGIRGMTK